MAIPATRPNTPAGGPGPTEAGDGPARPAKGLLPGLALGYFMVLMDTTVVTVALPDIGHGLHAGLGSLQWVSNGYTLTFAAFLLTAGALSDRFGGRRILLVGLWTFGLVSGASALAGSVELLVAARALLGVSGALLLPSSLAVIAHSFPDPAARARALGGWAAITGAALAAGPLVGGVLTDSLGWRAVFLVNVPLALVSIAITAKGAAETGRTPARGLDLPGQASAIVALGALTFGLVQAGGAGWTAPEVLGSFALFAVAAGVFVAVERRVAAGGRTPMLPPKLFRGSAFTAALFAGLLVNFALSGVLFTLSLLFQQGRGYSALLAGLAFLPLTLPTVVNPVFTGRLVARIGPRAPATAGFALMGAGTLVQAGTTSGSAASVVAGSLGLLLLGFGISYALPSLVVAVMGAVPRELSGVASGALNSARQTGAVVGVAVLGAILNGASSVEAGTRVGAVVSGVLLLTGSVVVRAFLGRERQETARPRPPGSRTARGHGPARPS
ncbi:MFS transporter [Streptomyces sp. NPDC058758]|uniref:MFS transporter n=1 Tax=Streptomyces sp. NPDC058758 TaxID=3346627 RepID=UPI0036B65253